jgi:hypothetical protein
MRRAVKGYRHYKTLPLLLESEEADRITHDLDS